MKKTRYTFTAKVRLYPGETANWHFVNVPKKESTAIHTAFRAVSRGWGSLPVLVKVGKTEWMTSIFLDRKSGMYLLPLKASIRKIEGLYDGDTVRVLIVVRP